MSLLRKPQSPILQRYNSLKINMRFQKNFGKKSFRRGLIFRIQTPLVDRSVVAESEAGMLFVVELDALSDGSLELLQEATSLQYETYCRLSLDPAVRHIRQTVSISVSRATSFDHPVGLIISFVTTSSDFARVFSCTMLLKFDGFRQKAGLKFNGFRRKHCFKFDVFRQKCYICTKQTTI